MKIKLRIELSNGAIRGNTVTTTVEIPDEDIEDYDDVTREQVINETVDEVVTSQYVYWDWEEIS